MIVYELDPQEEADTAKHRRAVLEALTPMHMIHVYTSVVELRAFLDAGLEEMRLSRLADRVQDVVGLTRVWLFHKDTDAIDVVRVRMSERPNGGLWSDVGFEYWPIPDGWHGFYRHIEQLRARARQYDPQIQFIHE